LFTWHFHLGEGQIGNCAKGEAPEWEWHDGEMPKVVGPKMAQKSGQTHANEGISAVAQACCPKKLLAKTSLGRCAPELPPTNS
jgi:hypothetical protein